MKRFRFRLEPVLRMRQTLEEERQRSLAEAQRTLDKEVALLRKLSAAMQALGRQAARDLGPDGLDIGDLVVRSDYLSALELRIKAQMARVAGCERDVEESRVALLEASRERKALDLLREKQLLGFLKEASMREQKSTEEVAYLRHSVERHTRLQQAARED